MRQVGVYDAKTHLASLIEQVEKGETITITRHGKPVARLVPIGETKPDVAEVVASIREFGKSHRLDGISIKELIEEGRRY